VNPNPLAASLDPNSVSPGLLGFIIVVLIGLVTWFLAKSMAKQLRRLEAGRLDQEPAETAPEQDAVASGPSPGARTDRATP
jgi:hypothetical protein